MRMRGPESGQSFSREAADTEFARRQDSFRKHFPEGRIDAVRKEDVPEKALVMLEERSAYLVHPDKYRPGNFEKTYVITNGDGSKTFVAEQTKSYGDGGDTEKLTYLADLDERGEDVGYGEIRMNVSNPSAYFKDKPFVGFTKTNTDRKRQGYGMRRLRAMNALSEMAYSLPLHSDSLMTPDAEAVWKKLVDEGVAEAYEETSGGERSQRYVFTQRGKKE
jgi:hypothetical protein